MKKLSKVWLVVAGVIIIALAVYALSGSKKKEEISFETVAVAPANIMNSITATGTIEPVTSVTVGTQVSGIVSKLYVDYNSVVKKGQVIAELDKLCRHTYICEPGPTLEGHTLSQDRHKVQAETLSEYI